MRLETTLFLDAGCQEGRNAGSNSAADKLPSQIVREVGTCTHITTLSTRPKPPMNYAPITQRLLSRPANPFRVSLSSIPPPCRSYYPLSLPTTTTTTTKMAPGTSTPRTPLKILMLHGYTQSGSLFRAKTRALEKHIQKFLPLHALELVYPDGPIALDPADIPGYRPSSTAATTEGGPEGTNNNNNNTRTECFGWWRRSNTADPPEYIGMDQGFSTIAQALNEQGPFDGVIGFSQGAAFAAMLASLLESSRSSTFDFFSDPKNSSSPSIIPPNPEEKVTGIPFPQSFASNNNNNDDAVAQHPPFKFAICYSGFRAPGTRYRAFYENPKIQTPVLHVLGSLDAIVDEGRSRALVEACEGDPDKDGKVVWHPGGHFLPSQRPYLDAAVQFIKGCLEKSEREGGAEKEERVEDMDLPF
ncbi:hypothetical protein AJ80_05620 [Polytolypa hystricis UAMH7299]|uniref:Serine hydrolase domain-containing protein n=1 Tax=Polytolypa hystricis (strain UAMH7299) TaxID=1447883 RepID=A0A2B7Y3K1_POLH7|nr:hypothetical protein AJ80_05620 [Polytolypa hystricis UAMH7299]